jgi:UDP-N-acetylmuramoyl-tripeptide--D-alanyl-D-alanine ligase
MISMRLSEAAARINGQVSGGDPQFRGCSIDTRELHSGEMFIALRGRHADGHDYLTHARERGASAALVERSCAQPLPQLRVNDARRGMGHLAAHWRRSFELPVVAITGSNGKTTVKEMLAAILQRCGTVIATRGNLNNDIGVPLTLFEMSSKHAYAVIEMGANRPGEIAWLCEIARPSVGLVTTCAPAHLSGFGSIEGVARAKGEIYEGLGPEGVAIINADDAFASSFAERACARRKVTFGMTSKADVICVDHGAGDRVMSRVAGISTPDGTITVNLALPGRHNAVNAAAATACAFALGIGLEHCRAGLEATGPVRGRLQPKRGLQGSLLLDDTYNANPGSLTAALEILSDMRGEHWLVLGDMGELGADAGNYHASAGRLAREFGVQRLYAIGELSRNAVAAFGAHARHFESEEALADALCADLHQDAVVLVKGSRAMHLERIVQLVSEGVQQAC